MQENMQLSFKLIDDIVFADKPAGYSTHAVDPGKPGFVELLSSHLGQELKVVHRLDKTTSGCLCFVTTESSAARLFEAFKNHDVKKRYVFVTDKKSEQDEFQIRSHIEKDGKNFRSRPDPDGNSETLLKRVKRTPFFELWEAFPKTGKPHQIRLHARDAGLSILGDTIYGGTEFPTLCLHSASLEIPGFPKFESPAPRFFDRLGFLKDQELVKILAGIDVRQRLFHFIDKRGQCLRLLHDEALNDYRLDQFGEQLWLYWYREADPTQRDLERWQMVAKQLGRPLLIRRMQNRGKDPNLQQDWLIGDFQSEWQAQENNLKFQFRSNQGLSPGLFLDQRDNRQMIQRLSKNKSVLNLFSYTCGFSVAAGIGGASSITSVDLSAKFLNWGKDNFRLNGLAPERAEFISADSFVFLKGAAKRGRKFDVIILDPPSFSRNGKDVFHFEKDFSTLVQSVMSVMHQDSILLFSMNYEKWSLENFVKTCRKEFKGFQVHTLDSGLDYESLQFRRTHGQLMKAIVISNKPIH